MGSMLLAHRLRAIREAKNLSQGEIEKRSGLKRSYISRVENGHIVSALETLEKMARALQVPLYQLFYEGEKAPKLPDLPKRKPADEIACGSDSKEAKLLEQFRRLLARMDESQRSLLFYLAQKMARR